MDVSVAPASRSFPTVDLLVVTVVEPPQPLSGPSAKADRLLDGLITRAIDDGEVSGKAGTLTVFHTPPTAGQTRPGPRRVAVVGVGDGADPDDRRDAGRRVAERAADLPVSSVALAAARSDGPVEIGAFIDGFGAGSYRYDRFTSDDERSDPKLTVLGGRATDTDVAQAAMTVDAVNAARDLGNCPANHLTPTDLATHARRVARGIEGLTCTILSEKQLRELGAGALLSVARGSELPARMIVLRYTPTTVAREDETLGIVGKAVTFDTGGISIKPASRMEEMKLDMAGGAAAIEGTALIARMGLPVRVICAVPSAENMPSGSATKPGDVITAMNGKTIEVTNTDAEGRLIMADALHYLATKGATRLIDFATLTGAIVVALGEVYAGLFGSDEEWIDDVRRAAEASGDLAWPMPLHDRYRPLLDSTVADLLNAAKKREAGAISAATFLREFTGDLPWCHVDIAGTGMVDGAGTGFGVRLLLALAQRLSLAR